MPEVGAPEAGAGEAAERSSRAEPYLLCRDCRHPVARPADRISVDGSHRHTFANPHGIVFEIGCFRDVVGAVAVGPASEEFTWFAGHRWRVCICAACRMHLGWRFSAAEGSRFYGLILDRLIEPPA